MICTAVLWLKSIIFVQRNFITHMSTLLVEVNSEQEKVLETLLNYMEISFQKLPLPGWDELSVSAQERINRGLADTQAGRYTAAQTVLNQLNDL